MKYATQTAFSILFSGSMIETPFYPKVKIQFPQTFSILFSGSMIETTV